MGKSLVFVAATAAVLTLGACAPVHYIKTRWDLVRQPVSCADSSFVIYFEEGSAQLTAPARQLLRATAHHYEGCNVTAVRAVGLADATGAPEANLTLSQQRARRVAEALAHTGLPPVSFEQGLGDQGAVRSDGKEEPMRRRAEVFITAKPR